MTLMPKAVRSIKEKRKQSQELCGENPFSLAKNWPLFSWWKTWILSSERAYPSRIVPLPSVEPSSITKSSQFVYVWAITDSIASFMYFSALYEGIMTETKGLASCVYANSFILLSYGFNACRVTSCFFQIPCNRCRAYEYHFRDI